uniref:Uncharacterized protein n=1 Tax=Xiphophorus maculatus TaxID=8083 RepID=A0A3B5QL56_XIPMA
MERRKNDTRFSKLLMNKILVFALKDPESKLYRDIFFCNSCSCKTFTNFAHVETEDLTHFSLQNTLISNLMLATDT